MVMMVLVETVGVEVVLVVEVVGLLVVHLLLLLMQLMPPVPVVRLLDFVLRHLLVHPLLLTATLLVLERREPVSSQRLG